jgi:deoxyribonuclease V
MAVAVEGRAGAAYVPGLMAAREGPVLQSAVEALPRPDVLIVNATGRDHPRRAGLAVHLGAVLDLPSVGVTDRCLTAEGGAPGLQRWSASPMTIGDEEVAAALRTRASARPVIVHPGWATELSTALLVVRLATRRARTPEPLRRARRLARLVRAGRAGAGEVLVRGEL